MSKICTSIDQSKKIIELGLDIYTADMYWWECYGWKLNANPYTEDVKNGFKKYELECIPTWSLSALLELIPELDGRNPTLNRIINTNKWWIMYHSTAFLSLIRTKECDNPLDAVFEMTVYLLENKLL